MVIAQSKPVVALAKYYAHLSHMQNMLGPWTSNGLTSTTESGSGSMLKSRLSNKLNADRNVFPEMQILLIQRSDAKLLVSLTHKILRCDRTKLEHIFPLKMGNNGN